MRARMIVILAFFFVYLPNGLQTGVVSMVVVVTVSCSQNQPDTVSNFTAQRAAAAACVLEKYLFEKGSIGKNIMWNICTRGFDYLLLLGCYVTFGTGCIGI